MQNAVESMNYDRLNQTINQTVNQALDEARVYKEKVRRQYEESQKRQAENLRKQAQTNQQSNVYQANYARPVGKNADQYGACAQDPKKGQDALWQERY